ncbi:UNVERIFIED_CONTAM: General transcription and DNA repair factor IIH helicase subunit XPB1 [Sesamum calycinum]|uniref:General transcription and DNA repair factor IIH helicase subunit XPB1 n=1 Tax=Sesamum calycinum TaxID=2727403 RepID=A0AAW2QWS0_9LAMI
MNGDKGRPSKKFKFSKEEYRASAVEDDYHFMEDLDDDQRDGDGKKRDFSKLELKLRPHRGPPPLVHPNKQAYDFLIAIAEPVCRPESMHEYNLTPHSLYAAVSVGLETETIISVLNKLSKTKLPKEMIDFIHSSTANYGKVKLVLKKNRYFVLKTLLEDEVIGRARISPEGIHGSDGFTVGKSAGEIEGAHDELLNEAELAAAAEEKETHSFEIDPAQVENVKQRCLPNALNYPMLEEYDFRNDTEMYYSTKRQQFLIDQGYSFKVLNAGDDAVGLEQLEEDADDIALQKARRSAGSMSAMSGAKGMVYMEYSTGQKKLQGQAKSKPKDPSKRHHLFKKRFG